MTQTHPSPHAASDEELRLLGETLSRASGETIRVVSVTRKASEFATLFPAEVLTATLHDGRHMRLFVKHLGDEQTGHPDKQRRDREVQVYQELLNGDAGALPVIHYYGSRRIAANRLELYLEYVDDWPLRYHDLQHWFAAARRLADLHAHFARRADRLRGSAFLLKLDEVYFHGWGERARIAVAAQSPELGRRVESLLTDYDRAYTLLADQPPTLVHNDLACKNVIADRAATPARTCIIDWELAGVGCGLLDLVHLKYGLDRTSDVAMIEAYRAQLATSELLPRDHGDFGRLLAACELHKTLYRLAHSRAWDLRVDQLAQWVADAEAFLGSVRVS
jgi:thiamine kinase-like enzyme